MLNDRIRKSLSFLGKVQTCGISAGQCETRSVDNVDPVRKFRFIPSGPMDFPLELVKMAGVGVLESLANLADVVQNRALL